MNRATFPIAILIVVGGIISAVAQNEQRGAAERHPAQDCFVIDGDTIACDGEHIRLNGIDAPEMPGHCRQGRACAPGDPYESRFNLASTIFNQALVIQPLKRDRYGRTVAAVYLKSTGEDVACLQLRAGAAIYVEKWDERGTLASHCKETGQ
jgi:micrococcal nuclease